MTQAIIPRISYRTTAAAREMIPAIKLRATTQREWDILMGLNMAYKSRIVIPKLKPGKIELGVKEILEVCQDPGAKVRIARALVYADNIAAG